jgi:signal transduction histidine kinase
VVLVAYRAATRPGLRPWVLAVVTFAILTVHDWSSNPLTGRGLDPSLLYPLLLTALAVGLGLQSRRVSEQREELRRLRDADRERAAMDERRRIALDLHDVAAHHLSSLVVHNRLALRLGTTAALQTAVEFSASTASSTLDSLRQVVGTLSAGDEPTRLPTMLLADLPAVLEVVGAAGLVVHLDVDEPDGLSELDEELQVALLRIVQESLSNVLRHRGPGQCWVALHRADGAVRLTVDDDGRPDEPAEDPAARTTGDGPTAQIGHGIVGMRERARSRGGRLQVCPSPRGGMRVQADFDVLPERV